MRIRNVAAFFVAAVGVAAFVWATSYTTTDPAATITDNNNFAACQTINVADSVSITDVNVVVATTHSWAGDLTYRLAPPGGGTNLMLVNRCGRTGTGVGDSSNLDSGTPISFDDEAPSAISAESMGAACPNSTDIIGLTCDADNYIPAPDASDTPHAGLGTNLAQFDGGSSLGVWTLCVADSAGGDTGTLTSWTISFTPDIPVELQSFSIE